MKMHIHDYLSIYMLIRFIPVWDYLTEFAILYELNLHSVPLHIIFLSTYRNYSIFAYVILTTKLYE